MPLSDKDIERCSLAIQKKCNSRYYFLGDDKDDLSQDAVEKFIKVYRDKFIEQGVKPEALALRVLDNLYIDRYQKEQAKNKHNLSLDRDFDKGVIPVSDWDMPEETIEDILVNIRWGGFPISPWSPNGKVYQYGNGKYRCADTIKYFNVRTNTIFGYTKVPWKTWILIMKEFISGNDNSLEISKKVGVRQCTSWKCLYKLKQATQGKVIEGITLEELFEICFSYLIDEDIIVPPVPKERKEKVIIEKKSELKKKEERVRKSETAKEVVSNDNLSKVKQAIKFCLDNDLPLPMEFVENYNKNRKLL